MFIISSISTVGDGGHNDIYGPGWSGLLHCTLLSWFELVCGV